MKKYSTQELVQFGIDQAILPKRVMIHFQNDTNELVIQLGIEQKNGTIDVRAFGFPMPTDKREAAHLLTFGGTWKKDEKNI